MGSTSSSRPCGWGWASMRRCTAIERLPAPRSASKRNGCSTASPRRWLRSHSPLGVITLFQPTRGWLRRFVDQRVYHIELDYRRIAKRPRAELPESLRDITAFERYEDPSLLGSGGMGEVYRAYHPLLDRVDAI